MRFWPRKNRARRPQAAQPGTADHQQSSLGPPGALQGLYNAFTVGSVPDSLEPRGAAEVYDDEIDPSERDPGTADEAPDPES